MEEYIKPPYQLSEQAQSLHTLEEWMKNLEQRLSLLANALIEAFAPECKTMAEVIVSIADEVSDAIRDNAYRPDGPVVRSTGYTLPDKHILLEEGQYIP